MRDAAPDERGQTFTLEAVVAVVLLLAAVAFALQAVSVSANTASPGDVERRGQHAGLAGGVLDKGAADGSLQATLRYWDALAGAFHGTAEDETFYVATAPPTEWGQSLADTFAARRVRYTVDLYYLTANDTRERQRLVESGTPGESAVTVSETVTLYDQTPLVAANGTATNVTLADVSGDANRTFYAPDARPEGPLYNVVRVEVTVWQT